MRIELTPEQKARQLSFRSFAAEEVAPHADCFDRQERLPSELLKKMAVEGFWGALIPEQEGGRGLDMVTFGLLNEEIGKACSSTRSLLTVHSMVAQAVLRWGSKSQKESWLPRMASGESLAALGLSEPLVGSDAKSVQTEARPSGDGYALTGRKKWITGGQVAGLFLIFAQSEGKPAAFLVERDRPGLSVKPMSGLLGVRASLLAELILENCVVPKENLVGRAGFGFSHVAATALDCGRYSVAWGCVGIAQACLESCIGYTSRRKQFGTYLKDHQLIRQLITEMITNTSAARLLCFQAGYSKDVKDPKALAETSIAKYFASRAAMSAAEDAVQIHGANGCGGDYPVQRYFRDAKIMEIIEGSTQIQQMTIADFGYQELSSPR
jgi:alkylation response protein AidB-like acyl-CoA dehydrogenase